VPLVLVAEDNDDLRAYLVRLLERDYRLVTARDGEEAERLALERLPDLVLSDVMMPRKDGAQLAAAIKSAPALGGVPVVLLTAKAGHDSKLEALELGADDYLAKPFDPEELRLRVRNLLEQRRRLRERYTDPPNESATESATEAAESKTAEDEQTCALVLEAREALRKHLGDADYGARELASDLGLSYSTFRRRLRDEADARPAGFVRTYRLERAAAMLTQDAPHVSEIAYAVGFRSLSYFSTAFSKHFGVPPSDYARASAEAS
jgi:DNA-binding response OmpR family regulator